MSEYRRMIRRQIEAEQELQREFNRLNSAHIKEALALAPKATLGVGPADVGEYGSFGIYKVEMVSALKAQQERIAAILAAFYRAELSISSVQPILDLAVELNPDLKKGKEPQAFNVGDSVNVLDAFRLPREIIVSTGTIDRISHQSDGTPLYWLSGRYTAVTSRQIRPVQ